MAQDENLKDKMKIEEAHNQQNESKKNKFNKVNEFIETDSKKPKKTGKDILKRLDDEKLAQQSEMSMSLNSDSSSSRGSAMYSNNAAMSSVNMKTSPAILLITNNDSKHDISSMESERD